MKIVGRYSLRALLVLSVLIAVATIYIDTPATVQSNYDLAPVLMVHGHGLSSDDWTPLVSYLIENGYPPEYLMRIDIVPNTLGNIDAAEEAIKPAVEDLIHRAMAVARAAGFEKTISRVDILGHSMGSVSARWYAARIAPEKVRTWISVGGANHGTNVLCDYEDDGASDMCPAYAATPHDSLVQVALNGVPDAVVDESPFGIGPDPEGAPRIPPDRERRIRYFTISIDPDEWILPVESATLAGAGGVPIDNTAGMNIGEMSAGNFRLLDREDHMSMLTNQNFHYLVLLLLSAP